MERTITLGRILRLCTLLLISAQVCLATVTVTVTPKVQIVKGESVTLPCTYATSGPSSLTVVEWHIESAGTRKRIAFMSTTEGTSKIESGTPLSERITMGEDMSLTISPVKVEDERAFICQVNSGPVGASEATTQLEVFFTPEKPVIKGHNQAISIGQDNAGSAEVGECVSRNGHPQPRIIWFKDSTPLPEVKDTSEKTYMVPSVVKEASGLFTVASTLYMQPEKADKDSVFHCTVEYALPKGEISKIDSDTFSLTLLYPTEHVTFAVLNPTQVKEGDEVKMKCESDANPQPGFEFSKEDKTLVGEGGILTLPSVTRADSGTYKCEALDFDAAEDAELQKTVNLSVHYLDPVAIVPSEPVERMQGEMVELQCKTKSSDDFTLQWKKDSKVLSQTGVLKLQTVALADAGMYSCVGAVPSVPGLVKEANISVLVTGKPEIDAPVNGEVKKEGESVTLTCAALGHPAPQFTWTPSGKESVNVEGNKVISQVTLEATAAVLKDGVTCEATNKHGTDSKKFQVQVVKADETSSTNSNDSDRADRQQGGSSGVVIAVVVCVLLLLLLVATLYVLQKKGKLPCGKKDKKEVASGEVNNDIVVEMKSGEKANEEAGLLNKPATEQS